MAQPTILVADDEPAMMQMMVRRLVRQGYEPDQAEDGRAALECIEKKKYDLIVTDIYMPGVTGLELLRQAKEADSQTQVIVVTAGATLENAIEALNDGAFAYLMKPFDHFSVFDNMVARALQFRQILLDKDFISSSTEFFNSVFNRAHYFESFTGFGLKMGAKITTAGTNLFKNTLVKSCFMVYLI